MSLVEKALKKLQEASPAPPSVDAAGSVPRMAAKVPPAAPAAEVPQPLLPTAVVRKVTPSHKVIEVNRAALRAAGLLPPEHQERQIADQYRQIKRPLIANAIGRGVPKVPNGHLIMTASALPNEGKTFTSINLAFSLALEKDISVLLVDADVPKPHISRIFGVENEPGLLDVLNDESRDAESLILPTDVPGLSILPAGHRTETATELLASVHMERTVARLGAYDPGRIVLLDSPPLLLTSESRALAGIVGQVVLLVKAGVTSQQAVLDAISHLGEGKTIGLILNQCDTSAAEGYYYGQSAYGDSASAPSQ